MDIKEGILEEAKAQSHESVYHVLSKKWTFPAVYSGCRVPGMHTDSEKME